MVLGSKRSVKGSNGLASFRNPVLRGLAARATDF